MKNIKNNISEFEWWILYLLVLILMGIGNQLIMYKANEYEPSSTVILQYGESIETLK